MNQRALFFCIVVLLFFLGMYGQYQISPEKLTGNLSTSIYEILMLFLLDGEWTLELNDIPLAIELVRFTAPLVAIASVILVIAANTRNALANYFVRFYRGHTIVVGLGEKSYQFLQTCHGNGKVVVVEPDLANSFIDRTRGAGFNVMPSDVRHKGTLERLNFSHADHFIIFTDSDSVNVEIALKLRETIAQTGRSLSGMRVHIHLDDFGLAQQLESHPTFSADQSMTEIYFFSVYDLSARLLLRDYPAEMFADIAGQPRIHLAIHGFGRLAEKIVIESLLLFQFRNQSTLRFTIYDEDIELKRQRLEANYPHISSLCDIEYRQQGELFPKDFAHQDSILRSVTQHIFCRDSDDENLAQALRLRSILLDKSSSNAPIFIRMQRSGGLAQLIHTQKGQLEIPDGIYSFGMLDQVLHVDNILSPKLDSLARAMHQMYVNDALENKPEGEKPRSWSQLTQAERKQNLLKADHWPVRLRAIRCESDEDPSPVVALSEQEASVQATMEHNRYVNQKHSDGWRYGEHRSDTARTNPYLLPWQQLPGEQQKSELEDALTQPAYFATNMGRFVKRKLVIGVTGHRLHRMDIHNEKLLGALRHTLTELRSSHPHHHFTILSPLAEGADRLLAKLAMEVLDARLLVPLPLPYELYISDFTSKESIEEFQRLVGQAQYCFEMPMKFGAIRDLASSSPDNEARNMQYALAGAYIVQRCDFLFSIYDGRPGAGTGGTGQVLGWYQQGRMDAEFKYTDEYFEPPQQRPAFVFNPYP